MFPRCSSAPTTSIFRSTHGPTRNGHSVRRSITWPYTPTGHIRLSRSSTYTKSEQDVFILALLTDEAHHTRMTKLRNKYFPKNLNKLAAHITLFHALPGSELETTIIPTIEKVASSTSPFSICATRPYRLGRKGGIALSIPDDYGGAEIKRLRARLQAPWKAKALLSPQDAQGNKRPHYTVMNKERDEGRVREALEELERTFRPDCGRVEGLGLWRYERGWWRDLRRFEFVGVGCEMSVGGWRAVDPAGGIVGGG